MKTISIVAALLALAACAHASVPIATTPHPISPPDCHGDAKHLSSC